ncbi:short-chain dehydrogenase [Paenarthrobacter sp. RAF9]
MPHIQGIQARALPNFLLNVVQKHSLIAAACGVIKGPALLPVNVVAPYVLTALVPAARHIYLSSSMHRGGTADLARAEWSGARGTLSYSDGKLLVTILMGAVARLCPDTLSHAVDPGWVPTKMGGPSASDDLELGRLTQVWLSITDEQDVLGSGQYWHHQGIETPHPAVHDEALQNALMATLTKHTGAEVAPPC